MEHSTFQIIWFVLWGVLWVVYFMLDGFDLGLGTILPFLGKTDMERRIMYNAVGPFWDGNEVWLVTAGGATFAAFPKTYAVMFSGLYSALLIILFALIVRGVTFEFRSKEQNAKWRSFWDICHCIGSFIPALLFGVAFANIFKGIPIDKQGVYQGTLFTLLNPFGILGGLLFVAMFIVHGLLWLTVKTKGPLQEKAASWIKPFWIAEVWFAVIFLIASWGVTDLWKNYLYNKGLFVVPALAVISIFLLQYFYSQGSFFKAWIFSCLTIVSTTTFGIIGLFPRLLPSSLDPKASLTIYNSSSSLLTLKVMTVVALIFVPLVIIYQFWAYKTFSFKIDDQTIILDPEAY